MKTLHTIFITALVTCLAAGAWAQSSNDPSDAEALKIAALEALMAAPSKRALPIVTKVLRGNDSDDVKERALFVLSQIDEPEADALLGEITRTSRGELQEEAIRMTGINGNPQLLAGLKDVYRNGDSEIREAVLEAYLIADDADAILEIANAATDSEEFESAVETLAAMGAVEKLRALRDKEGMTESLIEAYAVAGDIETLREMALDSSNSERQAEAIEGLAIAGDADAKPLLMQIYGDTRDEDVREAVLEAMLIMGDDNGVLELFRASNDPGQKRELLELLVVMDSDAVWDLIDATLENSQ